MAHCQGNPHSEACLWNVQQKSVAGGNEARKGSGLLSRGRKNQECICMLTCASM